MTLRVLFLILFTVPAWAQSESQRAAEAVNRHAFEAFQQIRQMTKGNFCYSPLSGHQMAALLVEGANDETRKQLIGMTHQPDDAALRGGAVAALREQLTQSVLQRGFALEIANSIVSVSAPSLISKECGSRLAFRTCLILPART